MRKSKDYLRSRIENCHLQQEVYRLYRVENLPIDEVMKKTGVARSTIYRYLRTFEDETPELAAQMKKRNEVSLEAYKKLQEENARLQGELKREKLRGDFYEEMVAFGKEVYGIDLKKAGTK